MIRIAEGPTGAALRRSLARWSLELQRGRPAIGYGFSVVCVAVALGLALASRHYGYHPAQSQLFYFAVAAAAWYAGVGPSVLAVALATACFSYFFVEPLYSFEVSKSELPHFFLFMAFAAVTAWFVSALRGAMSDFLPRPDLPPLYPSKPGRADTIGFASCRSQRPSWPAPSSRLTRPHHWILKSPLFTPWSF